MSGDTWASDEVVQECVTRALAAPLTPQTKILLSQRGLQFVEDYSNSIKRLDFTRAPVAPCRSCLFAQPEGPFFSLECDWLCSCLWQCAVFVWRPPKTAAGAGWNKKRSREWVRLYFFKECLICIVFINFVSKKTFRILHVDIQYAILKKCSLAVFVNLTFYVDDTETSAFQRWRRRESQ